LKFKTDEVSFPHSVVIHSQFATMSSNHQQPKKARQKWILYDRHKSQQKEGRDREPLWNGYFVCPTTDLYRKLASCSDELQDEDCRIIEIGCCTGLTTEKFLRNNTVPPLNILALDISNQFIKECQAKFPPTLQLEKINVMLEWPRLEDLVSQKWKMTTDDGSRLKLVVFVDIGGNREIESLLAVLQALLESKVLNPASIIVKSQALYDYGVNHHGLDDWTSLKNLARNELVKRRSKGDDKADDAPDMGNSNKKQKRRHPLKMPQRFTPQGAAICRYHNYDAKNGCLRYKDTHNLGKGCDLDHDHCHFCLETGHVALKCPTKPADDSLMEALLQAPLK
jgi:hypothetical protein